MKKETDLTHMCIKMHIQKNTITLEQSGMLVGMTP